MSEELLKCLLCETTELRTDLPSTRQLNLMSPHSVTRCNNCGLRFLNPRPSRIEYIDTYSKNESPITRFYPIINNFYAEQVITKVSEYKKKLDKLISIRAGKKLLEIGCCTGIFLNEAQKKGFDVEGVEPSEENGSRAKELYGLNIQIGSIEEQNYPKEYFDVVVCSHVFEHLLDPLLVARKINTWLRTGGFLLIEVPNEFDSFAAKRRRLFRNVRQAERSILSIHHTVFFNRKTLRVLVERSGFSIYWIRNVYYYSPISIWKYPLRFSSKIMNYLLGGSGVIEVLAQKK